VAGRPFTGLIPGPLWLLDLDADDNQDDN